jgi:glycosyltransferase domain-containing protein
MSSDLLTIIMPTRNRVELLASQLRLFAACDFRYPLVVADSSDPPHAETISALLGGAGEYRAFDPEIPFYDKLEQAVEAAKTPFVLLVPDRKVTLPHSAQAALEYLQRHGDCAAAIGYVLGFSAEDGIVDVNRIVFFTPTIGEDEPLRRHYHLMRRYQVSLWAVFRTGPLAKAIAAARPVRGGVYQEMMFMNALVLQGKICRLPAIFSLERAGDVSLTPISRSDPLYWFLDDSSAPFQHYIAYRNALEELVRELGIVHPNTSGLTQLIDVIHGVWMSQNFHSGVLNHAAELLLGYPVRPLDNPRKPPDQRPLGAGDIVHATRSNLSFIWRDSVLSAEPRDEIAISAAEIERAEAQLNSYFSG